MRVYEFRNIWRVSGHAGEAPNKDLEVLGPLWPYRRQAAFEGPLLGVDADSNGMRELGVYFVTTAGIGGHVHLDCEPGLEFSISHETLQAQRESQMKLKSYTYEAAAVLTSGPRPLKPSSRCRSSFAGDRDSLKGAEFWVDGDSNALLSLGEHCLDLAEAGTATGTELAYAPGAQMSSDSIPFRLRRIT